MNKTKEKLASYVNALRPIIYINHFDFSAVDALIQEVAEVFPDTPEIYEYNDAFGYVDFQWKNRQDYNQTKDLATFLTPFYETEEENFLVLKDIHFHLEDPKIIALLKAIALKTLNPKQEDFVTTIFIVASKLVIPTELEKLITVFDFPLLQQVQIEQIIQKFAQEWEFTIEKDVVEELALSCKGLSEFEIKQILYLAYDNGGSIDISEKKLIIQEKEQIIKKTGSLEIVNFKETIDAIGGLNNLKSWLKKKAKIFKQLDKAREYGVDIPKGIMLVGMPGCGKSLVAKATSRLFEVPLLRLDIGKLLGKYVGESEANFRQAIKIAEAVSPCILYIDEIEKAFAGIGGTEGDGGVTKRLFGSFLTWLQEKENTVFVVATANDISKFPPEFLRKGRFD
ncbi:AAA family ATPase, partial [Cyanothece sp. BG0011]|uniref:AAA family ATPase n=1 Tax=Cyanothece sp. BG0011 TaxID=2082950 RepID=UPI000D1F31F1